MWAINSVIGKIFDIFFLPFRDLGPWAGMAFVSLATAFLMLWIFRLSSNQAGIRKAKNAIKAHLLELRLFKDNMRVSFRAQKGILKANLRYIGYNTKPLLIMIIPLVLILAQLNLRFGYRAFHPGEETLVKIKTDGTIDPQDLALVLEASGGIAIETEAVRIPDEREMAWRVRAVTADPAHMTISLGGRTLIKSVIISGNTFSRKSPMRTRGFVKEILYPGEKPLPGELPLRSFEILYPPASLMLFGLAVHWIIAYFVLSIAFGFAFKGVFRVEI